jgi:shikimate dehydrogenase
MRLFGLVGKNISYSFSKDYFEQKFIREGISDARYINLDLKDIAEFPEILLKNPDLAGLNVTIPYKEAILPYIDHLSDDVRKIQAVNTIKVIPGHGLSGHNTDHIGFSESLKPLLTPEHQKALIFGTGGAAKAVCFALSNLGIQSLYVSRNPGPHTLAYEDVSGVLAQFKILVNCTPMGSTLAPESFPPIAYHMLTAGHIAYDLVYNPSVTVFLAKAQEHHAQICNGYQMLQIQAEESWRIWNS